MQHSPQAFPDADWKRLRRIFVDAFPPISAADQRLGLALYRLLAEGAPVSVSSLANAAGRSADDVRATLAGWTGLVFDDAGRIAAYWGLSVPATGHRLEVDGRALHAWCAWDTLFLPELLDVTVRVVSSSPATGKPIELHISPRRIESVLEGLVVSFLTPEPGAVATQVTSSFCCYVHFFENAGAAAAWLAEHKGSFAVPLDEAFDFGQALNRRRFPDALDKGHTST